MLQKDTEGRIIFSPMGKFKKVEEGKDVDGKQVPSVHVFEAKDCEPFKGPAVLREAYMLLKVTDDPRIAFHFHR